MIFGKEIDYRSFKKKETVALVGFAPTSRSEAPFENPDVEIWGINEAYHYDWMKRWDQWFQIHPMWDFMRLNNRNDPKHWEWLQQEHGFPIWMQYQHREVPSSVRYPIEDAIRMFGMYFTSSFSYMMALAILMGYRRIEIYGFDMSADSEYVYQKAGAEYLIGYAKGLGIEVYLPIKCPLLRGNMYAYEDLRAADRTYYGLRKSFLEEYQRGKIADMHRYQGRLDELNDLIKDDGLPLDFRKILVERVEEINNQHKVKIMEAAAVNGATDEMKTLIEWHDSQSIPADRVEAEVANEQAQSS